MFANFNTTIDSGIASQAGTVPYTYIESSTTFVDPFFPSRLGSLVNSEHQSHHKHDPLDKECHDGNTI